MQERRHDVPDQKDRQIGWAVVRPRLREVEIAFRAALVDLEIGMQQVAFATARTFAPPALGKRGPGGARVVARGGKGG